jgi:thioredoxin-like negative regulator of GroEL
MSQTLIEIQDLIKNNDAVLIYFSTNHCAPCVTLRPKVSELLKNKFPKMKMAFIDAESAPQVTGNFNVFSSPTILIFFDGKETKRYSKYISISELEQNIQRYYDMIFEEE